MLQMTEKEEEEEEEDDDDDDLYTALPKQRSSLSLYGKQPTGA